MNFPETKPLAVIVPAYKAGFLRETLASIAAQTDQNFQLYVFDDASPDTIGDIVREFTGILALKYHRFPENMGGKSLVKHWERCLRLTAEPWIWLFADDDTMDPGCVAAFLEKIRQTRESYDAYRFNSTMISAEGKQLMTNPRHPDEENGGTFLLERWRGARNSYLQELIFSRRAWETVRGIPDFPLAWHSDDAFMAELGLRRPIKSITGPRVNWRWSNTNITSDGAANVMAVKVRASAEFIPWALDFIKKNAQADTATARDLSERWFFRYLSRGWHFFGLATCLKIESLTSKSWGHWRGQGLLKGMEFNFKVGILKVTGRIRKIFANHAKNPLPDQSRP